MPHIRHIMDINQCQHGEPYVEKLSTSSGHEELGHEENYELFCRRLKYVVAVFIIFAFSFFHRAGAPSQGHWSMDTKQELTRSEENDKEMLRSFGKVWTQRQIYLLATLAANCILNDLAVFRLRPTKALSGIFVSTNFNVHVSLCQWTTTVR